MLQPSLVFGEDGSSTRAFLALATLPLLPLPGGGRQIVQPVHVDDVVAALCALLAAPPGRWGGLRIALVGPRPLTLRRYLLALRRGLGLGAPAVEIRPLFTQRELSRFGVEQGHEVKISLFRAVF